MKKNIDCFVACKDIDSIDGIVKQLSTSRSVRCINIISANGGLTADNIVEEVSSLTVNNLTSSETIRLIAGKTEADYTLLLLSPVNVVLGLSSLERMVRVAADANAALVYGNYYVEKQYSDAAGSTSLEPHPVIDYQEGSIRDDFDFGPLLLVKTELLHKYTAENADTNYLFAGLYDLRLFLSRNGAIFHIDEYLYTVGCERKTGDSAADKAKASENQFEYVNPANREVQIEMEKAATAHLRCIDALVNTADYIKPDYDEQNFPVEASVIIPVRNRERTIVDAVKSALEQKTRFEYNVIVVDNHSTDNTTRLLEEITDEKLIHIIPEREDLGIGGCWNVAINDSRCGRFAVQLDSDDLYSSPNTLQKMVDAFRKQHAAMVVGSYRICDFDLNTLPPGLISHSEWTIENGPNNALRINGLGAPRAFFTPILRQIQFPNTSYGEDYALGLIFSRYYNIGRIYEELYLCRRWGGNSDSSLTQEKINANNKYKDQLRTLEISARRQMWQGATNIMTDSPVLRFFYRQLENWEEARLNYRKLHNVKTQELACDGMTLIAQHNPERMRSTNADLDKATLTKRPCFLCEKNRPDEQFSRVIDDNFELLVNPYPILPIHFTIPLRRHEMQQIRDHYGMIHTLLTEFPELTVFYNGPKCGASAPDHAHLQAGIGGNIPLIENWTRLSHSLLPVIKLNEDENISLIEGYPCCAFLIQSRTAESDKELFVRLYDSLPISRDDKEPMMNLLCWRSGDVYNTVVFPRTKHRPECYSAIGKSQYIVSPGALDMAGLIILPREEDFNRITPDTVLGILQEVSLTKDETTAVIQRLTHSSEAAKEEYKEDRNEPDVAVGIMSREKIVFTLNGLYTAKGENVVGEQVTEFSEGGILWKGNLYRELEFIPQRKDASFSLHDVTIGVNFHWERNETQTFNGALKLVVESDKITAINQLPVERYLTSVISSEMKDTASPEFLRAHAVISRSWLLAQMQKRHNISVGNNNFFSFTRKDDEIIRWYDREDHTLFDVCADDHCQRYQGITKACKKSVMDAIKATKGQILMYDDEICDARFSKCCGGATEEFRYCWEDTQKPYLVSIKDGRGRLPDLTKESEADKWIRTVPDAFCNTKDEHILSQVLQDYDRETQDFYRWKVEYTQSELASLIAENLKEEFGDILDLVPIERGKSGRICRLKIVGTQKTLTVGKELEIRRILSDSHLYSSAFVVDKNDIDKDGIPGSFTILGAGWGHGVGLCQIGAAVMGEQGYDYDMILLHYYRGATIKKIYD